MKRFIIILAAIAVGCGEQPQKSEETSQPAASASEKQALSYAIRDLKDAPECKETNQNQLIFIVGEKQFYTCDQDAWVAIELGKEEKGDVEEPSPAEKPNTAGGIEVAAEPAGENCPSGGIAIKQKSETLHVCNGQAGAPGQQGGKGENGNKGDKGDQGETRILAMYYCPQSAQFAGGYQARSTIYHEYADGKKFIQTSWEIVGGANAFRTSICVANSSSCDITYSNNSDAVLHTSFSGSTASYSATGSAISAFSGSVSCTRIF